VAPWEAALGAKVTVPTLDGKISLSIQPGSQSGQRLRVKGRGLPTKTGRGDLYVILKVVMPDKNETEKTRDLWENLQKQHPDFDPRATIGSKGGGA
jgi:curved DNA-binding protein